VNKSVCANNDGQEPKLEFSTNFGLQFIWELVATPSIPQSHSYGTFCGSLPNDVFVKLLNGVNRR
jgi:hypothetical protein